jgi:hypothetical protein
MKKVGLVVTLLIVLLIGVIAWKFIFPKKDTDQAPKPQGLAVSKHSEAFNVSMNRALNAYYDLTEAFVNWDTAKVTSTLAAFKITVDSIQIPEMKKDSDIYQTAFTTWESIKADVQGMQLDTSLYERREDLNMLSDNMFNLLRIVKYDAAKVYYHECPMALNNNESKAFWLSSTGDRQNRRNPYLGLHDPKFGKSMLDCGTTRDSINFSADTSGKK